MKMLAHALDKTAPSNVHILWIFQSFSLWSLLLSFSISKFIRFFFFFLLIFSLFFFLSFFYAYLSLVFFLSFLFLRAFFFPSMLSCFFFLINKKCQFLRLKKNVEVQSILSNFLIKKKWVFFFVLFNKDMIVNLYKFYFPSFYFSSQPNKEFSILSLFHPFNQTNIRKN